MNIKSLHLKDFRNYVDQVIELKNGINILTGANAQGKTNAGEAIFLLCTGYSPRANKDKLLIRHGQEQAEISATASSLYGDVSVEIKFFKNDNKAITVSGNRITKIADLLGNIHSVFFNPQELKLVQESPEDRRRFMNVSLSQISKSYFYALQRYNKILLQRNNLLKSGDYKLVKQTLPVWDEQLSTYSAKIISERIKFINELAPIASLKHSILSGEKEGLVVKLDCSYDGSEAEIKQKVFNDLCANVERDLRLGYTSIGPHRDDIKFILNGQDVRVFGSQGQQRTVALALKLAETDTFKARFGEYPVLILDDAMSELDKKRRARLIDYVKKMQTIITCTEPDCVPNYQNYNNIVVENGKLI